MAPLALPISMAVANAGANALQAHNANNAADKQNAMRALQLRGAAWTGRKPQEYVNGPSVMGELAKGAVTGAQLGASASNFMNPKGPSALETAQTDYLNNNTPETTTLDENRANAVGDYLNDNSDQMKNVQGNTITYDAPQQNPLKNPSGNTAMSALPQEVKASPGKVISAPSMNLQPIGAVAQDDQGNWLDKYGKIIKGVSL